MPVEMPNLPISGPVVVNDTGSNVSPFVDCMGKRLFSPGLATTTPGATLDGAILWDDGQGNITGATPIHVTASTVQLVTGEYVALNNDGTEPAIHVCGVRAFLAVNKITPVNTTTPTTWLYNPFVN